jgi:hypothetical protein
MHCTESADYTSAEPAKYVQLHTNVINKFSSVKTHLVQAEKTIHLRCQINFSNFSEGGRHTGVRDHGKWNIYLQSLFAVFIPEIVSSIRSWSSKSCMDLHKTFLLSSIHPHFDCHQKPLLVRKSCNTPHLTLQGWLSSLKLYLRVGKIVNNNVAIHNGHNHGIALLR